MAESLQPGSSSPTSARSEDGDSHEIPKKPDATTADHPQLVNGVEEIERAATATVADGNEYQWYYEGCNGWWQYDERTSQELEEAYLEGKKSCKILVAGFVYIVMFEHKCQVRQNDATRIRRVKRDLVTIQKKGVAGLRLEGANQTRVPATSTTTNDLSELSSAMGEMNLNEGASTSTSAAGTANVTENEATAENAAPSQPAADCPEGAVEEGERSGTRTNPADDEPDSETVLSPNATGSDSTSSDNRTSEQTQEPLPLIDLINVQQEYFTTDEEEGDDDDNLLIL
ncbi:AGAP009902-PA-like protein [Anopheles sinensis]|uniref:E3 ubiquitin-protein ligase n=1 Tax=Anopheles sinensis TaxID=74873 RepID=A0A084W8M7_ANOSI|nr:AGAP009902-PA-like protein [Anopheles sinensis]